jgi:dihydroxy-acid dehydratase
MIELDVEQRKIHLDVADDELKKRKAAWSPPKLAVERGYVNLYINHVLQADQGADLDFLRGNSGSVVTRDSH